MLTIIKLGVWLKLSDNTITKLLNVYCKIRYGLSFREMLIIMKETEKEA